MICVELEFFLILLKTQILRTVVSQYQPSSTRLLPAKAVPIASLNLSIIHWFLSQNIIYEQKRLFQMESCEKHQI